ncbi:MAG: DUF2845 domain-containing protein [Candidatus Heimdallarchaeota archaeon]|nr:DUF2845 domain-containing protein [Candidatus Heimdallarchaeota archaeon]
MRWLIIIIALGAVGVIGFTQMEYVRCDGKFVRPGATKAEVLERCGEPINRETSERERVPLGGQRVIYEGQYIMRDEPEESTQVMTFSENWTYNISDKIFILTFTGESQKDNLDEEEPTLHLKKIEKL